MTRIETNTPHYLKREAQLVCASFLGGFWGEGPEAAFGFEPISGGSCNRLFRCSLDGFECGPKYGITDAGPVVVRFYGNDSSVQGYNPFTRLSQEEEAIVVYEMSAKRFGPKLYGLFCGGRVEEYINSRVVSNADLLNPQVNAVIARKVAQIHRMDLPFPRQPMQVFDKMETLYAKRLTNKHLHFNRIGESNRAFAEMLLSFDIRREIDWLQNIFSSIKSPVVFSHNDLNICNILLTDTDINHNIAAPKGDDSVVIIDYEFCGFNYRGMDIGNHFVQRCFNYSDLRNPFSGLDYPSRETRRKFAGHYLGALQVGGESVALNESRLMREIDYFALVIEILAVLWILSAIKETDTSFAFWEYGAFSQRMYLKRKSEFESLYR